jgi:hypothetical protein
MAKKKTKKPASKPAAKKASKAARKKPAKPVKPARKAARKPAAKAAKRPPAKAARKKTPAAAKPSPLPPAMAALMEKAWPDYLIDFARLNFDSSYLAGLVDKLRADLHNVEPGAVFHERAPIRTDAWMADDMADLPSQGDFPRSYYLFFVGPQGGAFEGPCETVDENEAGEMVTVRGQFRWGWTIGISFVSPVAALVPDTIAVYPNGAIDYLELNLHFSEEESPDDAENGAARARLSPDAWDKLAGMRDRIVETLGRHGIQALGRETLGVPVARLQAGEGTLPDSEKLRVKDAFFFRSI